MTLSLSCHMMRRRWFQQLLKQKGDRVRKTYRCATSHAPPVGHLIHNMLGEAMQYTTSHHMDHKVHMVQQHMVHHQVVHSIWSISRWSISYGPPAGGL